jgi:hypothetical protein
VHLPMTTSTRIADPDVPLVGVGAAATAKSYAQQELPPVSAVTAKAVLPEPAGGITAVRGNPVLARRALARAAGRTADLIASLPEPRQRSPEQRATVTAAKDATRALRAQFMDTHADAVYNELTGGRTLYLRLAQLVGAVASAFPRPVPGPTWARCGWSAAAARRAVPPS